MLACMPLTLNFIGDGDTQGLLYDNLYVHNIYLKINALWVAFDLLINRNKFVIKIWITYVFPNLNLEHCTNLHSQHVMSEFYN